MLYAEDGNVSAAAEIKGLNPEEIFDFSSNVNPSVPSDAVKQAVAEAAGCLHVYPDPAAVRLRRLAANYFGVSADEVLAGSGATEFIFAVPRRFGPRRIVVVAPCYHGYWRAIQHAGGEAEGVLASEADEFIPNMAEIEMRLSGVDMIFFGNPNNPTGVTVPASSVRGLALKFPSLRVVVDESYVEFVPERAGVSLLAEPLPDNVIVLRSLSAFHGMAGLRLGFMIASADVCSQVQRTREPWTVNCLALRVGEVLLGSEPNAAAIREEVIAERERIRDELSRMTGLRVFQSQTNFLLIKITRPSLRAAELCERMLSQKILIRNAAGFRGLDSRFIRVSLRAHDDNNRLLEAFQTALDEARWK